MDREIKKKTLYKNQWVRKAATCVETSPDGLIYDYSNHDILGRVVPQLWVNFFSLGANINNAAKNTVNICFVIWKSNKNLRKDLKLDRRNFLRLFILVGIKFGDFWKFNKIKIPNPSM